MAPATYKTRALVLRKTKLREKDLIVTLLDEGGALVRGVAKGARRPGGSLAAKLELFSAVEVMLARGRNLDVVTEARFAKGSVGRRYGPEQAACASCIAELLSIVAQEGLPQEILFQMGLAAFSQLEACDAQASLALCAAGLLKLVSAAGVRPRFESCAVCASPFSASDQGVLVAFSPLEGGCVCASCPRPADALVVAGDVMGWCRYLMGARFVEVAASGMGAREAFEVLEMLGLWVRTHFGRTLKSLDFLFASGLFA